jgi:hypothetical protein
LNSSKEFWVNPKYKFLKHPKDKSAKQSISWRLSNLEQFQARKVRLPNLDEPAFIKYWTQIKTKLSDGYQLN